MSGVVIDIDTRAESAKRDLRDLNKSLAQMVSNSMNSGKSLEKISAKSFENLTKVLRENNKEFSQIKVNGPTAFDKTNNSAKSLNSTLGLLSKSVFSLATAFVAMKGVTSFNKAADDLTTLQNRLKVVSKENTSVVRLQNSLNKEARDARGNLKDLSVVYTGLAADMNGVNQYGTDFVKTSGYIYKAALLSGSSVDTMKASLTQLNQGLSSGVLRGEELSSVAEGMSYYFINLAKTLGVTTGEMRKMAAEGMLTKDILMKATSVMASQIDKDFAKMNMTVAQASDAMFTSFSKLFGSFNLFLGSSPRLSKLFFNVSNSLENFTSKFPQQILRVKTAITNYVSYLDAFKAAELTMRALLAGTVTVGDISTGYKFYAKQKDLLARLRKTDTKDTKDEAESLLDFLQRNIAKFSAMAFRVYDTFTQTINVTLSNLKELLPVLTKPLANYSEITARLAKIGFFEGEAYMVNLLTERLRKLQAVSERVTLFLVGDTELERAWVNVFKARDFTDFITKLRELNDTRDDLTLRNKGFSFKFVLDEMKVYYYALEDQLIRLGVKDKNFFKIRQTHFDRFLMYLEDIKKVIGRVYNDIFAVQINKALKQSAADLEFYAEILADSIVATFSAKSGKRAAKDFFNFIKSAFSGIKDFVSTGLSNISFSKVFELIKPTDTFKLYFNNVLKSLHDFSSAFSNEFLKLLSQTDLAKGIKIKLKVFKLFFEEILTEVRAFKDKLMNSMSFSNMKIRLFSISDNKTFRYFVDLIDRVYSYAKSKLPKVSKIISDFAAEIKQLFFDIYDKVVGHSYWPDMIDGVIDYTSNISSVLSRLQKFKDIVKGIFNTLYNELLIAGKSIGGEFGKFVDSIVDKDWNDVFKKSMSSVGANLVLYMMTKSDVFPIKALGYTYFLSFLDGIEGASKFAGETIGSVMGRVGGLLADALVKVLNVVINGLPSFIDQFIRGLDPLNGALLDFVDGLPNILFKVADIFDLLNNKLITGIMGATAVYGIFAKDGFKKIYRGLFGYINKQTKEKNLGLFDYLFSFDSSKFAKKTEKIFDNTKFAKAAALAFSSAALSSISLVEAAVVGLPLLFVALFGKDGGLKILQHLANLKRIIIRDLVDRLLDAFNKILPIPDRLKGMVNSVFDLFIINQNDPRFKAKQIELVDMPSTEKGLKNSFKNLVSILPELFQNLKHNMDAYAADKMSLAEALTTPEKKKGARNPYTGAFEMTGEKDYLKRLQTFRTDLGDKWTDILVDTKARKTKLVNFFNNLDFTPLKTAFSSAFLFMKGTLEKLGVLINNNKRLFAAILTTFLSMLPAVSQASTSFGEVKSEIVDTTKLIGLGVVGWLAFAAAVKLTRMAMVKFSESKIEFRTSLPNMFKFAEAVKEQRKAAMEIADEYEKKFRRRNPILPESFQDYQETLTGNLEKNKAANKRGAAILEKRLSKAKASFEKKNPVRPLLEDFVGPLDRDTEKQLKKNIDLNEKRAERLRSNLARMTEKFNKRFPVLPETSTPFEGPPTPDILKVIQENVKENEKNQEKLKKLREKVIERNTRKADITLPGETAAGFKGIQDALSKTFELPLAKIDSLQKSTKKFFKTDLPSFLRSPEKGLIALKKNIADGFSYFTSKLEFKRTPVGIYFNDMIYEATRSSNIMTAAARGSLGVYGSVLSLLKLDLPYSLWTTLRNFETFDKMVTGIFNGIQKNALKFGKGLLSALVWPLKTASLLILELFSNPLVQLVSVAGVLGTYFFGPGDTFFEKLGWAWDKLKEIFGLGEATSQQGRLEKAIGAIKFSKIGAEDLGINEQLKKVDWEALDPKDFESTLGYLQEIGTALENINKQRLKNRGNSKAEIQQAKVLAKEVTTVLETKAGFDQNDYLNNMRRTAARIEAYDKRTGFLAEAQRGEKGKPVTPMIPEASKKAREDMEKMIDALGGNRAAKISESDYKELERLFNEYVKQQELYSYNTSRGFTGVATKQGISPLRRVGHNIEQAKYDQTSGLWNSLAGFAPSWMGMTKMEPPKPLEKDFYDVKTNKDTFDATMRHQKEVVDDSRKNFEDFANKLIADTDRVLAEEKFTKFFTDLQTDINQFTKIDIGAQIFTDEDLKKLREYADVLYEIEQTKQFKHPVGLELRDLNIKAEDYKKRIQAVLDDATKNLTLKTAIELTAETVGIDYNQLLKAYKANPDNYKAFAGIAKEIKDTEEKIRELKSEGDLGGLLKLTDDLNKLKFKADQLAVTPVKSIDAFKEALQSLDLGEFDTNTFLNLDSADLDSYIADIESLRKAQKDYKEAVLDEKDVRTQFDLYKILLKKTEEASNKIKTHKFTAHIQVMAEITGIDSDVLSKLASRDIVKFQNIDKFKEQIKSLDAQIEALKTSSDASAEAFGILYAQKEKLKEASQAYEKGPINSLNALNEAMQNLNMQSIDLSNMIGIKPSDIAALIPQVEELNDLSRKFKENIEDKKPIEEQIDAFKRLQAQMLSTGRSLEITKKQNQLEMLSKGAAGVPEYLASSGEQIPTTIAAKGAFSGFAKAQALKLKGELAQAQESLKESPDLSNIQKGAKSIEQGDKMIERLNDTSVTNLDTILAKFNEVGFSINSMSFSQFDANTRRELVSLGKAVDSFDKKIQESAATGITDNIDAIMKARVKLLEKARKRLMENVTKSGELLMASLGRLGLADESKISLLSGSDLKDLFELDNQIEILRNKLKGKQSLDSFLINANALKENLNSLTKIQEFVNLKDEFRKSMEEGLTKGAMFAFDRIKSLPGLSNLTFKSYLRLPEENRKKSLETLNATDMLSKMDKSLLSPAQIEVFNKLAQGADPVEIARQLTDVMSPDLKYLKSIDENTAMMANKDAVVPTKDGTVVLDPTIVSESKNTPKLDPMAELALSEYPKKISDATFEDLQKSTKSNLIKMKNAFEHYGQSFSDSWLGASDDQARQATELVKNIDELNTKLANELLTDEMVKDIKRRSEDYQQALDAIKEKLDEASMKKAAEDAGKAFSSDVTSGLKEGLKDLMKGKTTFAEFGASILDKVTGSIVDTFVEGMSKRFMSSATGFLGSIGESVFNLGASATGQVSLETAGVSLQAAAAELTAAAATLSGSGAVGAVDKATGAAGIADKGTSFLDKMGTKISDLFSGLWGSLKNVFGGIGDLFSSGGALSSIGGLFKSGGMFSFLGGFASGGAIRGPGTGTSDSIAAMVSNGEFIVNAKATKEHLGLLQALNSGKAPKFATGGLIGDASAPVMLQPNMVDIKPAASANSSGSQQIVNLTITGDISRQTKAEIYKMLPNIAEGVNNHNKERGYRR